MQAIPNLLLMPELVEKVKRAKGKEVETIVISLFDMTMAILQNDRFNVTDVAEQFVKAEILAVSIIGGVTALITLASSTTALPVIAAGAGLLAAGVLIITSFLSFIYSLFTSGILFNRSFFGIVLNDTDKDLSIPD